MLPIVDITKFTMQDYPEHTACIVWFAGCNLKCQYCHNVEFFNSNNFIPKEEVFDFLNKRIDLLDGIVFSGGECTLTKQDFVDFVKEVKDLGYKIKIDSNGLNFDVIKQLVENNMVDFVALDYKAEVDKFKLITQVDRYNDFRKSLEYLIECNNLKKINLEIRTTVHIDLLDENDINSIIKELDKLGYCRTYYIQNFRNDNKSTLNNLKTQSRLLNKNLLTKPINFVLDFRNFF